MEILNLCDEITDASMFWGVILKNNENPSGIYEVHLTLY
jgi:hypothetical protein